MKKYLFSLVLITNIAHAMDKQMLSQEDTNRIIEEARQAVNNVSMNEDEDFFAEYNQQKSTGHSSKRVIRDAQDMKRELHETGKHIKILDLIYSNLKEGNNGLDEPRGQMINDLQERRLAINTAQSAAVEFHKYSDQYIKLLHEIESLKK